MTTITSIISNIDKITPIIKNKYISYDELQLLQDNIEPFLQMIINSKNSIASNLHVGLDILFPAMDHLKLFLEESDLGSIALVSKTLYNLMIKHFTQFKIDVSILHHYMSNDNYKYNVDVNFFVQGQKLLVPINAQVIAHKKARTLFGYKKYLENGGYYKCFKDDFIHDFNKEGEIRNYNTIVCIFCEKPNLYHDEHTHCAFEYYNNDWIKYPNFDKITNIARYKIKYNCICPELEYLTLQNLKINMPTKMKFTCKGIYNEGKNNTCSKCGILQHIHDIYEKK